MRHDSVGSLRVLLIVIGGPYLVACSSGGKESSGGPNDGSTENIAMDGTTEGDAGPSGDGSTATLGDGGPTPPADGGACPGATTLCNDLCLAAGQTASGCTVLVAGIDSRTIAVAGGYVYYDVSPAVWRVPTTGGTPASFVSAAQYIEAITTDSTNLYVTASGSGTNAVVGYAPLAGGAFKTLDDSTRGDPQIGGIAVDATHVYWVESPIYSGYSAAVYKVAIAGDAGAIAIGNAQDPVAIAVDSTDVYWADSNTAIVWATPTATAGTIPFGDAGPDAGGATELFSTAINNVPAAFAVDSNYLYWGDDNTLSRWPKDGGAVQVLANDSAAALVLDGTVVYTLTEFGEIVRYDTVAMTSQVLATVADRSVGAIGIDATNVYVLLAPYGQGAGIVRVAK
jgi:hypothetical protein